MGMQAKHQEQVVFHLSGRHSSEGLSAIDGQGLWPALLAPYRQLASLRHDFPLVLVSQRGGEFVQTLSELVDAVLRDVAPRGIEGERVRRHGLQLETEIRRAVDAGAQGSLAELWEAAAGSLGLGEGDALEQGLTQAGGALRADGEVLGCNAAMPASLMAQAWKVAQHYHMIYIDIRKDI